MKVIKYRYYLTIILIFISVLISALNAQIDIDTSNIEISPDLISDKENLIKEVKGIFQQYHDAASLIDKTTNKITNASMLSFTNLFTTTNKIFNDIYASRRPTSNIDYASTAYWSVREEGIQFELSNVSIKSIKKDNKDIVSILEFEKILNTTLDREKLIIQGAPKRKFLLKMMVIKKQNSPGFLIQEISKLKELEIDGNKNEENIITKEEEPVMRDIDEIKKEEDVVTKEEEPVIKDIDEIKKEENIVTKEEKHAKDDIDRNKEIVKENNKNDETPENDTIIEDKPAHDEIIVEEKPVVKDTIKIEESVQKDKSEEFLANESSKETFKYLSIDFRYGISDITLGTAVSSNILTGFSPIVNQKGITLNSDIWRSRFGLGINIGLGMEILSFNTDFGNNISFEETSIPSEKGILVEENGDNQDPYRINSRITIENINSGNENVDYTYLYTFIGINYLKNITNKLIFDISVNVYPFSYVLGANGKLDIDYMGYNIPDSPDFPSLEELKNHQEELKIFTVDSSFQKEIKSNPHAVFGLLGISIKPEIKIQITESMGINLGSDIYFGLNSIFNNNEVPEKDLFNREYPANSIVPSYYKSSGLNSYTGFIGLYYKF